MDGVEYQMSPLNDHIIASLDNWLRTSVIRMGREAGRGMSSRDAEAIMSTAFLTARRMSWFTEGSAATRTVEGSARFLFETCRKYHPSTTVKQFEEAIRDDPGGLAAAWDVFELLNPARGTKKKTTTETPTPTRPPSTEPSAADTDGRPITSPDSVPPKS